ncbi:MAG: hypothetical protein M0038_17990 [Pseudomonadota bacterium]|jgi:hypothetical protein|nr:hypothetical protein [Pseudomonadota bacterium]
MNVLQEVASRAVARELGRAIPVRQASSVAPDPACTIGVATVKIVTEEQVQAIAFGSLNAPPHIVVRLDPLGRDAADLLPFAKFTAQIRDRVLAQDEALRVWVPHEAALESIDVLGHRYATNTKAADELRDMGAFCRIIADEATFPGQQLVVNAAERLREHVVTGMAPIEEHHLGSLLAWLEAGRTDALAEARRRARVPASGVLPNTPDRPLDDRVEFLRKRAKHASSTVAAAARAEIEAILRDVVRAEWNLLVAARNAFWGLQLTAQGLEKLFSTSQARVRHALENGFYPTVSPERIAARLGEMEAGRAVAEHVDVEYDTTIRAQARRSGTVVAGRIVAIDHPRPKFKPCRIEVESAQAAVRVRRDEKVKIVGAKVSFIVREIEATPAGGTRLRLEVDAGVRAMHAFPVGTPIELIEEPYAFVAHKRFSLIRQRQPWIYFGTAAPTLVARPAPATSPLELVAARRRQP